MNKAYDQNNNLINAKDLNETHKGIKYKCFNSDCNGEFLFRNVRSNYKQSCFYYNSKHHDKYGNPLNEHLNPCWCLSSNSSNNYESNTFNLDDFMNNLNTAAPNSTTTGTHKKNTPPDTTIEPGVPNNPIKIRTLRQLYNFCKSNDPETYIGSTKIKDLYVYAQTLDYYKSMQKDTAHNHLFLLERRMRKEDYSNYSLQAKCIGHNNKFLLFNVVFPNKDIFDHALNSFFKNASGSKFAHPKTEFLILSDPGQCIPIPNSNFSIQTLSVRDLKFIHII